MSQSDGENFNKSYKKTHIYSIWFWECVAIREKNPTLATFGYSKWIGLGFKVQWRTMKGTLLLAYNIDETAGCWPVTSLLLKELLKECFIKVWSIRQWCFCFFSAYTKYINKCCTALTCNKHLLTYIKT